ncbi:caspase family protein [Neorhodopirellula lusitana]|uniref:caspase family protein n=1 Tax=Neorhodopirellula lusitana TaxID=445327 RepID=UPI00384A575D
MTEHRLPTRIAFRFLSRSLLAVTLLIVSVNNDGHAQAPPKLPPEMRSPTQQTPPTAVTAPKLRPPQKPEIHPPELMLNLGAVHGEILDLAFSPDGKQIAVAGSRVVNVHDVATGARLATIRGDRSRGSYGSVNTLAYAPDGEHLLIGIYDHHQRGSIRVYHTSDLTTLQRILPGLSGPCRHINFSPSGRRMVACDTDGEIAIYDWQLSKQEDAVATVNRIASRANDSRIVDELSLSEDEDTILAIESDGPHAYSVASGNELTQPEQFPAKTLGWMFDVLQKRTVWPFDQKKEPRILDFDLNRSRWAAASFTSFAGATKHWAAVYSARVMRPNAPMLAADTTYDGHRWAVNVVEVSPTGKLVASGDKFGEVHLWNANDGKVQRVIKSVGRPIYASALDANGERIGFTRSPDIKNWGINQYGKMVAVMDLRDRVIQMIDQAEDFSPVRESIQLDDDRLVNTRKQGTQQPLLQRIRGGQVAAQYRLPSGKYLSAYTFVNPDSPNQEILGTQMPVLYGDHDGFLGCWDASNDQLRRAYRGHENMITSISVSPESKVFVTSSTDKTIRAWSLKDYDPSGIFDFRYEGSAVYRVDPGTDSARAGVRPGDRIVRVGGITLTEFYERLLLGERVFDPGQRVRVEMKRGQSGYAYDMTLRRGFDYVEPLLNLFIRDARTWVMWTPEGYYDCSPGADSLIGWHVNHGPNQSAEFFKASQFRDLMYRPDVVRKVLAEGVFDEAIADLEAAPNHRVVSQPLRDAKQFAKVRPPVVEILEPTDGKKLSDDRLTVKAIINATGEAPITEVTLLVNGVPAKTFRPQTETERRVFKVSQRVKLGNGRNEIAWVASAPRADSDPDKAKSVVFCSATTTKPNLVALAIGVNAYQHSGKTFSNLKFAAADAKGFENAIKQHSGGMLYQSVQVRSLIDSEATRAGVLDGISWWTKAAKDGDMAVLFFSMHGFLDDKDRFYLAGHDCDRERLRATGIDWQLITDALHHDLPRCRRMVFIDACHAGGVSVGARNFLNELSDPKYGVTFFASCGIRQKSMERAEWNHGAFTKSVLDAMRDKAADISPRTGDGLLEPSEINIYVRNQVLELTNRRQDPQVFPDQSSSDQVLELVSQ